MRLLRVEWRKISPASEFDSVAGVPSFGGINNFGRWDQVVVVLGVVAAVADGEAVVVEAAAGSVGSVVDCRMGA